MRGTGWLTAVLLLGAVQAQDGNREVATRSLLPFQTPRLQYGKVGFASALHDEWGDDVPRWATAAPDATSTDWFVDWLRRRHQQEIDAGTLDLTQPIVTNGRGDEVPLPTLSIAGTHAAVETCAQELDALAAAFSRAIEVTAWRLTLPEGELPATQWSPAMVAQALDGTTPIWTARGVTRSGGGIRLGSERWLGHLRDYDVEVAEKARISDPKADAAFAGLRLGLRVHELPNEQLLLDGEWLLSEPVAMREQGTGEGQPTIDLPEHRTAFVAFGGRIASGGGLAVAGRGGGVGPSDFLLVVRARYLAPPSPLAATGMLVQPISALVDDTRSSTDLPGATWLPGEDVQWAPDDLGGFGQWTGAQVLGLLTRHQDAECRIGGGALLVSAPGATCASITTTMQALLQDQLRTCELRCDVRGKPTALQLATPMLAGRTARAFVGHEQAIVADSEVEIATKAQMPNPVVRGVRAGLWSRVRAVPLGRQLSLEATWEVVAQGPLRTRLHASLPPAVMQLTDARSAAFPWDGPIPIGAEQDLGDGPSWSEAGAATRLFVRVSQ